MDARALALVVVSALNSIADVCNTQAEELELLISGDDDGDGEVKKASKKKAPAKSAAKSKSKKAEDDDDDDEPTEDDLVAAVRAAQKVIERDDILKILKSKGKAGRATEVAPEKRRAVMDALEAAIDEA